MKSVQKTQCSYLVSTSCQTPFLSSISGYHLVIIPSGKLSPTQLFFQAQLIGYVCVCVYVCDASIRFAYTQLALTSSHCSKLLVYVSVSLYHQVSSLKAEATYFSLSLMYLTQCLSEIVGIQEMSMNIEILQVNNENYGFNKQEL